MNNAEIIKGIDLTIEGLKTIKNALVGEESHDAVRESKEVVSKSPVEVRNESLDIEKLKAMKYNDFKKYAASLGVKCTGTRDEILERILAVNDIQPNEEEEVEEVEAVEVETVEEPVEEEAPVKSDKLLGSKKSAKKQADEPTTDEYDEQAKEIAESTDVEDIIEALADVDIKANKRNAVTLLAKALREGLIEVEADEDEEEYEEDEDEDTAPVEVEEADEDEISATSYFAEFDPKGYNNPETMTDERAEAIEEKMDEILTNYSEGELSIEDISSYIEDNATDEEIDLLGDEYEEEDVLKLYMELVKRTIDNDGEEHEPAEPYEVADKDVCCGHELKYIKKTKKYVCEHCGTEYEAE